MVSEWRRRRTKDRDPQILFSFHKLTRVQLSQLLKEEALELPPPGGLLQISIENETKRCYFHTSLIYTIQRDHSKQIRLTSQLVTNLMGRLYDLQKIFAFGKHAAAFTQRKLYMLGAKDKTSYGLKGSMEV